MQAGVRTSELAKVGMLRRELSFWYVAYFVGLPKNVCRVASSCDQASIGDMLITLAQFEKEFQGIRR